MTYNDMHVIVYVYVRILHKRVHVIVYGCITAGLRVESWLSSL